MRVGSATAEYYSAPLQRFGLKNDHPEELAPSEAYELEALMESLVPPAWLPLGDGRCALAQLAKPLFDFQQAGVRWMVEREVGFAKAEQLLHPLWDELILEGGDVLYVNRVTGTLSSHKFLAPPAEPGGCLADEMGLGKTAMMLGLFASHPRDFSRPDPSRSAALMASMDTPPAQVKATLVRVCFRFQFTFVSRDTHVAASFRAFSLQPSRLLAGSSPTNPAVTVGG